MTSRVEDLDQAANLARTIMQEVLDREDLSCSVGVAPNKMLAKIGSDFRKPYGLTVISEEGAKEFLSRQLWILGKRLYERAQGFDPSEVVVNYETRSIGRGDSW